MNLGTRRIGIVAVAAAAVLVIVWYVALFRPEAAKLKTAHSNYAAAQSKLVQLRSEVSSLEVLQKQIPADKQRLATLDAAVPKDPDLKDVLDQLHGAAASSGVDLSSVSPSSAPTPASSSQATTGGVGTIQLSMSASGTYPQLMAFVTQLTGMARTVAVNNLSLSNGGAATMSASLNASIFYSP